VSENLELVRSIFAAWERGDYSSVHWAHPDIEFVFADWPSPESINGVPPMGERWRDYMTNWHDMRAEPEQYHELDEERVLVLFREQGRGRISGLAVGEFRATGANLFHVRDGKVTRLVLYLNGDRALADLDLEEENVEIVKRVMAAYMRNDETTVRELVTPDLVISMRPDQPDPREYHGYKGMLHASGEWLAVWDAQSFEPARIWAAENLVFVRTREVIRGSSESGSESLKS